VQKLFIKAFTLDGSGKSLLVDEGMSVAHVCRLLADKNHVPMDPKWAVVEHLPDLFMGESIIFHLLIAEPTMQRRLDDIYSRAFALASLSLLQINVYPSLCFRFSLKRFVVENDIE